MQRNPQVVVQLGVLWLKGDRPLECGDGGFKMALFLQANPQIVEALGAVGLHCNGLLVGLSCLIKQLAELQCIAKVVMTAWVGWFEFLCLLECCNSCLMVALKA